MVPPADKRKNDCQGQKEGEDGDVRPGRKNIKRVNIPQTHFIGNWKNQFDLKPDHGRHTREEDHDIAEGYRV